MTPGGHGRRSGAVRVGGAEGASQAGLRPARAPLRARLPAVELPVAADERARRRVRRVAGGARAVPASRCSTPAARCGPPIKPMSVRISATDWVAGRLRRPTTRSRSRGCCHEHGCDIVDVSSGQVSPLERPAFGRSFQTPFADRIRNEVGIPTIAVGAIASYDDVNTIVLRRPRRPVRARAAAPVRPALDAARRRRAGVRRRRHRVGAPVPGRVAQAARPAATDGVRKELERTFEPDPPEVLVAPEGRS